MSRDEIRLRLNAARKIFPINRICKLSNIFKQEMYRFIWNNENPNPRYRLGPMRLKRLAKIILDIETGVLKWNGKTREKSKVEVCEPSRPAMVVHRVMFENGRLEVKKGVAPTNETMPSFGKLFGGKAVIQLPKLSFRR